MSTNSDTTFSMADDGSLTETPIPSQPKCTRMSPCSKADCPFCNGPASNHHVRDLTKDLETTPTPKKLSKPPAPPNHIFSTLTEEFKQALLDEEAEDVEALLTQYDLFGKTCPDFLKFDRTMLMKLVLTGRKLHKGRDNPQPTLTTATYPLPYTPPSKPSCSMKINKLDTPTWSGETYDLYSWLTECETVFTAAAVKLNT